jgi:uncharacterized protein YfiM (DUF2279 family)
MRIFSAINFIKMAKITFRKQKNEIGLARVCQSPRGYAIFIDGKEIGQVTGIRNWNSRALSFMISWQADLPTREWYNSASENQTFETKELAKEFAKNKLKEIYGKPATKKIQNPKTSEN